jgi:uncharacterized protein (TIGR03000 family)
MAVDEHQVRINWGHRSLALSRGTVTAYRKGSTTAIWAIGALMVLAGAPAFPAAQTARTARLTVNVPHADTVLSMDGRIVVGMGIKREVETPALAPGERRRVVLSARWEPNPYTTLTRTTHVTVRAGQRVTVDLTVDDPGDRVRVMYVPTPADVAEAMVDLAGVRAADIVYEPGCGDARITIAAIRRGAKRALCIDLDPARAVESRDNVKRMGLTDRIEVREGDALDVKDLSEVTVVFLYMGDHFNLLIRPILWRMLKPGARIVSHRFTMGDWPPDRTVSVESEDFGTYELHLWTITEDVKRKAPR